MTTSEIGRRYIEEARGRVELVRLAQERGLWATVVREAQEAVEWCLKGALRIAAVEPARTHDVADVLRREERRFPAWFRSEIPALASISTEMAGDRGMAFYGDERQGIGPQDLFDADDAARAIGNLEHIAALCTRLFDEAVRAPGGPQPER
jgi:HEPN domain-containing protein